MANRKYRYEDMQPVLERLLQDKESDELEFKTAAGGFPKSFWSTYSSFANTNGGAIVFGVKEKDEELILDGLDESQIAKLKRDFFNGMHSKQNINIALLKEDDVFDVEFGCSREEVNSMFADANLASPVDGRILKNFSKDDLDPASIQQYRRRFEQWNPDHVWNSLPEDQFLEKLNVFRKDRKTGEYGLTYAGLLMFGTYSAIMDENPNFFPDYQEIVDKDSRWVNRICPDGNWESNLFQFYSKVLPILQNFLPKPFILEDNQRKTETPAHVAVREALSNMLVHADHTENATLNVYKYPNKMVFSNPGTMLISPKQFYKGGESICRNKYLQTMFTFLGSAEKAGSGADKIIHGWEKQNWKRPYIVERSRPNKVILTMSMESLLDENVKNGLIRLFGERVEQLPQPQLMTLAMAYSEEEITNERLQYALDIHRADITKMLSDMCAAHLLEASGHGRGTKYHVYGVKLASYTGNLASSAENLATSKENLASPAENLATSEKNLASSKKKRFSKLEIEKLILDFCTEWRTIEDIATFLDRDKNYIRNEVLPHLADKLVKMYENVPNHPRQKYRVNRKD